MWSITCGTCKHEDEAERFFTSQKNKYACPACGVVWRIERQGVARMTESGFVIPPKNVIVIENQMELPKAA